MPGTATSPRRAFVKINDRQRIELIDAPTAGEGQLDHLALYTADAERMRQYLATRGVQVPDARTEEAMAVLKHAGADLVDSI